MGRISKIFTIALVVVTLAAFVVSAQDTESGWDHHFTAGDLSMSLGGATRR